MLTARTVQCFVGVYYLTRHNWFKTICANTNGKGKKRLWITRCLRAARCKKNIKFPGGRLYSYKCQIGFSNELPRVCLYYSWRSLPSSYNTSSTTVHLNAIHPLHCGYTLRFWSLKQLQSCYETAGVIISLSVEGRCSFFLSFVSFFFFVPCNAVKGIVGQTIDKPQVAAHGDHSPSHCQWTPLRGRPKSWKPLRH